PPILRSVLARSVGGWESCTARRLSTCDRAPRLERLRSRARSVLEIEIDAQRHGLDDENECDGRTHRYGYDICVRAGEQMAVGVDQEPKGTSSKAGQGGYAGDHQHLVCQTRLRAAHRFPPTSSSDNEVIVRRVEHVVQPVLV